LGRLKRRIQLSVSKNDVKGILA